MTYATLMVHLDLGQSNAGVLQIAADLAESFKADVIGIVACQPVQLTYGDECISWDIIEQDRKDIDAEIQKAEADFRSALRTHAGSIEWRSIRMFSVLADDIAREARRADIVITSVTPRSVVDAPRWANTSDLVMQVGRPILIVPKTIKKLNLDHVVVAWKDTRESRRAAFDALPLLRKAARVTVAEIAAKEDMTAARMHVEDVILWLNRHGVVAESIVSLSTGDDATRLQTIAEEQGADVIVAGAYGHSRIREWALGGVTHDLLLRANRCALVSH